METPLVLLEALRGTDTSRGYFEDNGVELSPADKENENLRTSRTV